MLIELAKVTKTYGKVTRCGACRSLPEGAIGLLGPNGAGKTTMIRTLLGLIALDSGEGRVLGMDIRAQRLAIRQAVGFVPEDECLFPGMVGVEFVAYAGELVGMRVRGRPAAGPRGARLRRAGRGARTAGSSRTRPA